MINQLRKKLIFIYTCSTGIILAIVLMMALAITNQQLLQNRKENFQNNFMTVTQKLLINNEISHFWLAEMEMKNRLILSIEDNGEPFIYKGAWKPATERDQLVEMVKTLALKDKINTDIRPASVSEVQSKIYELKGKQGDRYFGAVFLVAAQKGYRSVVMLQYRSENYAAALRQKILMIALYLSGITALYFVSRWIVGKSLRPIEESRRSQTQFIASASHELKSPLAVISANASAMLVDQDRTEHYTQGIQKECRRLSSLIEDLLLLAATDAGKWNLKKELIDMDLLLIETFEAFQPF
ncbi:MAG: sensor histidine kinase, partial [Herbinix sp.]|nr:sensor histidine kinase [Herbinix sp.]